MRRFSRVTLFLVVLYGAISLALSACYNYTLVKDGDEEYCEYKRLKIYPGSVFLTPDCKSCVCSDYGLSCCGYGKALLGIMRHPPRCQVVTIGCEVRVICPKPLSDIKKELERVRNEIEKARKELEKARISKKQL